MRGNFWRIDCTRSLLLEEIVRVNVHDDEVKRDQGLLILGPRIMTASLQVKMWQGQIIRVQSRKDCVGT